MGEVFSMTEPKTQYESMVDEQKQNEEICLKYGLYFHYAGYLSGPKKEVCEVIKKLEIDIFNLRESLKLSQELNASYEKTIKELKAVNE